MPELIMALQETGLPPWSSLRLPGGGTISVSTVAVPVRPGPRHQHTMLRVAREKPQR